MEQNISLEVTQFLRNCGSQFLFLGYHATRIGGLIPEESRFTIPILGESYHLQCGWRRSLVFKVH